MKLSAPIERLSVSVGRILGRVRLDVVEGVVTCPIRGRIDVESCSSCPFWRRTQIDTQSRGVVICRSRTLCAGDTTSTPPM